MKLYIATPMYGGQCLVPYAKSLIESVRQLKAIDIETRLDFVSNESLIQRARNLMAHKFYHSGCTHMLFVDADIGFDFQQILRLITHAAQSSRGCTARSFSTGTRYGGSWMDGS